ncbi:MAG: YeeE/YedE family protein [Gammaproteobacteria bacterium]|nr:YeeE/YedE family protein [Gammaproteobacteria bacterium]MDH3506869.1 YeeE/YedE family protein [Gammaproteobacteria bacterium]
MHTNVLSSPSTAAAHGLPINARVVGFAGLLLATLGVYLGQTMGWRGVALMLVGLGAGWVLYHASFGFGGAWRNAMRSGKSAGLRVQMVMLAVTALVFIPLIAKGELFGLGLRGNVAPLSVSLLGGAFLFGIGMQLGGACASGTLYTVGGGSTRMVVTLIAFIAGSALGAWHFDEWQTLPSLGAFSLLETFGAVGAILATLALAGVFWAIAAGVERRRQDGVLYPTWKPVEGASWLKGPWPLLAGALGLALVNIATLVLSGRPWGITSGFALWGSKVIAAFGADVASWPYWQQPSRAPSLAGSVFEDITSIMNFGIILGALMAAGIAGRFAPVWRLPARSLLAAVVGGVLLGYGARLAYGCNIGALFSGVASASLHGWVWFVAAFVGNGVGMRLRPLFRLDA